MEKTIARYFRSEPDFNKKLFLGSFESSELLKDEIRQIISQYDAIGLELINISCEGAYVSLNFTKRTRAFQAN